MEEKETAVTFLLIVVFPHDVRYRANTGFIEACILLARREYSVLQYEICIPLRSSYMYVQVELAHEPAPLATNDQVAT